MTGGFSARYGDKLSGVFDIRSRSVRPGAVRFSGGVSMMNFRGLAEGTFDHGRGSWLVSARRGYIDLVLKLVDPDHKSKPRYFDVFGKMSYLLNKHHVLTFDGLHAHDDLIYLKDGGGNDSLLSSYENTYAWFNLHSQWHPRINSQTVVSWGQFSHERRGQDFSDAHLAPDSFAEDLESSNMVGFKTDWQYEAGDMLLLEAGLQAQSLHAEYDYLSCRYNRGWAWYYDRWQSYLIDSLITTAQLEPSGWKLGSYVSSRTQINEQLTAEIGCRFDRADYTDDRLFSPRIGLAYQVNPQTSIRVGWGHYYQIQGIHRISVIDRETDYFPAQKAVHHVCGLEHQLHNGIHFRAEAYYKKYSNLRPSHRNTMSRYEMFPELEPDRQTVHLEATSSQGLELYAKHDRGGKLSWFTSYALAKVEDSVRSIYYPSYDSEVFYNETLPSPRDIRHTFHLDVIYRPNPAWQFNLAFQHHTGWPLTSLKLVRVRAESGEIINYVVTDKEWGTRFEPFHRLDLRINRFIPIGAGRMSIFAEVVNLYGRENVRSYSYMVIPDESGAHLSVEPNDYWFGVMPSIGISYEVGF